MRKRRAFLVPRSCPEIGWVILPMRAGSVVAHRGGMDDTTTTTTTTITTTTTATATPTTLEVVQELYGAFGRGELAALFALLHPEVDWSVSVDAPGAERVPMLRNGIGQEAAQAYFAGVAELEIHVFEISRLLVDGDVAVAEVHFEATHRTTGRRASIDELHHWTVRDGVVVRYRPYVDTARLIQLYLP